jgi:hypothetical protein
MSPRISTTESSDGRTYSFGDYINDDATSYTSTDTFSVSPRKPNQYDVIKNTMMMRDTSKPRTKRKKRVKPASYRKKK